MIFIKVQRCLWLDWCWFFLIDSGIEFDIFLLCRKIIKVNLSYFVFLELFIFIDMKYIIYMVKISQVYMNKRCLVNE